MNKPLETKADEGSMNDNFTDDKAVLPRLLASNALRANLSKHMTLNQMADHKASMIITAASLILTISVTQFDKLGLAMFLVMVLSSGSAILFSIFAIIPVLHVKGFVNLFYFRSFAQISEDQFVELFKETVSDKDKLYDAYLREIYYLGKYRLTYKYRWISGGLWSLLFGLAGATVMTVIRFF